MTLWFKRGIRYTVVGFATFFIDLALLFFLIDAVGMNIFVSTALAFIIALSLNFAFSRRFVFPHSERSRSKSYAYFMAFALFGMILTVFLMWVLVTFTILHFTISRTIVAIIVGFGNYYVNLFLNFKVAGVELKK